MTELVETHDPPLRSRAERLVLLKQYLPLVRHVAGQYGRKLIRFHDFDDLVAMGQLAVWNCTLTYREDRGASFKSYAYVSLVHRYELLRRMSRSDKRQGLVYSIDESSDESGAPSHQHAGSEQLQDAHLEREEGRVILEQVLGRLSSRERRVIEQRFVKERTFEDIAGDWGISRERIRQIEKRAIGKLRIWLRSYYPESRGAPRPVSSKQAAARTESQIIKRRYSAAARKVASIAGSG